MTDPQVAEVEEIDTEVDLEPVVRCLTGASEAQVRDAWPEAQEQLLALFDAATWGISHNVNLYGQTAHANLYNVECQSDFRNWLIENDVSIEAYGHAIGEVQYVSIQVHLQSLLERGRSNRGWRIRLVGFPPLKIVAIGLSSHYQGTQNHNQMGAASRLIRSQALEVLPPDLRQVMSEFRSATAEDWEERGLMPAPVLSVGTLDISDYDDKHGAKLRMVRNTTVKKELATFFALKGMSVETFTQEGLSELRKLRSIALALGRDEAAS